LFHGIQNSLICIFLIFLRFYIDFTISLFNTPLAPGPKSYSTYIFEILFFFKYKNKKSALLRRPSPETHPWPGPDRLLCNGARESDKAAICHVIFSLLLKKVIFSKAVRSISSGTDSALNRRSRITRVAWTVNQRATNS